MKHYSVTFEPDDKTISIHSGATILEAAEQAGIILNNLCGGAGTCQKCAVNIAETNVEVLACQHHIENDLTVTIGPEARFFQQQILQQGIDRQIKLAPSIRKQHLRLREKTIEALQSALSESGAHHIHRVSGSIGAQFEKVMALSPDGSITIVCHKVSTCPEVGDHEHCYDCLCLEPGDTTSELFGVAMDIGTTTVVSKLIDLSDGKCKATAAATNPQIKFGDDVITRIAYGGTETGLEELHATIIDCVNELICRLCAEVGVDPAHIYEITIAGNTTMNHIFLKFPVTQLGRAPYAAYSTAAHDRNPSEMGLKINACGNVHTIENIAGFVGSDTTAVGLAVGMDSIEEMTLVIDIGTNGELILGTKDRMFSASCAAGPALEGAKISQGSRAAIGAIERVVITDGDIGVDVIGGGPAHSICGSGLIDAVAVLLELGLLDMTGRFTDANALKGELPERILRRVITHDGQGAFVVAADKGYRPVVLTQKDIRETQLAKAAIRAGIRLLQNKMGIGDSDICQVLLAGAFGNYIQKESAWRIGLLPNVELEKVHFVGNAASSGAQMVLLSDDCKTLCGELVKKIEYIEIAHETDFQMVFADSLMFNGLTAKRHAG